MKIFMNAGNLRNHIIRDVTHRSPQELKENNYVTSQIMAARERGPHNPESKCGWNILFFVDVLIEEDSATCKYINYIN